MAAHWTGKDRIAWSGRTVTQKLIVGVDQFELSPKDVTAFATQPEHLVRSLPARMCVAVEFHSHLFDSSILLYRLIGSFNISEKLFPNATVLVVDRLLDVLLGDDSLTCEHEHAV